MILISPLKASPAPLRYVKLQQNRPLSIQQKHRAVFCLLILPAFPISGACLLQMLEIFYLIFSFCHIRSVRWVQPPCTLADTVITFYSFPSCFINMASSTPVPIAKHRTRPPSGRTKAFQRKPCHMLSHSAAGKAIAASPTTAVNKWDFVTVTTRALPAVRGFATR